MKGKKGLEQSFLVCAKLSVATLLLVLVFLAELMAGSEKIVEELKLTDWALVCEQVGNRSDCRIEQSMAITPGTSEVFVLSVQVGEAGTALGKVSITREIYLVPGLEVDAPPEDTVVAYYEFCDPHLCHAKFTLSKPLLLAFKRGSFARVRVWRSKTAHVDFPVSLHGFTAGFEYLDEVTP